MINFVISIALQASCSPSNVGRFGAPSSGHLEKGGVHVFELPDLVQQLLDRIGLRESIHDFYFDTKMAAELGELPGLVEFPDLELGEHVEVQRRRGH